MHEVVERQQQAYLEAHHEPHEHDSLELVIDVDTTEYRENVRKAQEAMEEATTPPTIELPDSVEEVVEEALEAAGDIPLAELEKMPESVPEPEEEPDTANVFDRADPNDVWDWEKEKASRSPEAPYILHQDEYLNDQSGYVQKVLTYYAGDDILTDESDTPIYNHHEIVGELVFGHGSNDSRVVYVRNEMHRGEYEILLDNGHYAQEILGLQAEAQIESELRHSEYRFRADD
jgi:hypothetical protein